MVKNCFRSIKIHMPVNEIVLVGCGGTGGFLAELLARMIKGFRLDAALTLYDGDRVGRENVVRQNFLPSEIGRNKAAALALRLAGQMGIAIQAKEIHFDESFIDIHKLMITATDNLASRRKIANLSCQHWIDVGNELTFGQAIYGHTSDPKELKRSYVQFNRLRDHQLALPSAAALNPAILKGRDQRKKGTGCIDAPFARQGFGVNVFAASAAALLAKQVLVDRAVKYHAVYFNLETGWMRPRRIDRQLFAAWK
jgi:PRTRC genetic system ThiF family protein